METDGKVDKSDGGAVIELNRLQFEDLVVSGEVGFRTETVMNLDCTSKVSKVTPSCQIAKKDLRPTGFLLSPMPSGSGPGFVDEPGPFQLPIEGIGAGEVITVPLVCRIDCWIETQGGIGGWV